MKNTLFCPQFSPQNAANNILGLPIFKIFWGSTSPRPPPPSGTNMPVLIQSVTLFNSTVYFNFYWNPWYYSRTSIKQRSRYNEVLGVTNDFLYPSNSKIYGKKPQYNETFLLIVNTLFLPVPWPFIILRFHCIIHKQGWVQGELHYLWCPMLVLGQQEKNKFFSHTHAGCKESQFYSLPFGQAVASMY